MTDDAGDDAQLPADWLKIGALDLDGQGVARRADGKVVFVEGALPFELVSANVIRRKNNWEQASLAALHRESSQRVRPRCPHFGLHHGACGGCKMQHLHVGAQVAMKQRVLEDNLWHLAKVKADTVLRPIEGPAWGYRWRARFSVRYVRKKGVVLVGFHERKSRYVADIRECHVVPSHVSDLLLPLRDLIGSLDAIETCPQIELACGEEATALVLRHLEPLSEADIARLRSFADAHARIQWWLQPAGPDTVKILEGPGAARPLAYTLPEFGITMPFRPTDFTQVNPYINQVLVSRALRLLDPQPGECVIDWFCGLGNFTLPIATRCRTVYGIEGSKSLVARSRENYASNLAAGRFGPPLGRVEFADRNLFEFDAQQLLAHVQADRWLVDPPREGAFALAKALADLHQQPQLRGDWKPPRRIVYVSCNPSTLARDAGLLVHQGGYRCSAAGVVNMFPHTAHVESIAVFEADEKNGA
jgi:23S rRNA (uracil1939-C5)-methyltransferase